MQLPSLELPAQEDYGQALIQLINNCSAATFGKSNPDTASGGADILDPSYRKALKLDADRFITNINLSELGILHHIKRVLAPDAAYLKAELYKLNIHQKGDFFKAHVDTPRGENMLCSLVIVLPSIHTGGALTVEHNGVVHTFDWALQSLPSEPLLQWGAFYSDCKHEVHKITSGARITLTYNLLSMPPSKVPLQGVNVSDLALHKMFKSALETPGFLDEGGTLAFGCEHAYAHNSTIPRLRGIENQLKGSDACLFAVATHLGLHVTVQPVYKGKVYQAGETESESEVEEEDDMGDVYIGRAFGLDTRDWRDDVTKKSDFDAVMGRKGASRRPDLLWCRGFKHKEVAEVYMAWDEAEDDCEAEYVYSYAAILIDIPSAMHRLTEPASELTASVEGKQLAAEAFEPLKSTPGSLADLALKTALQKIKTTANRVIACGGTVQMSQPPQVFESSDGWKGEVRCLELSRVAPCGKGQVLEVEADRFLTNIDLAELGLLEQIKTVLAPDAADVLAVLHKLNIDEAGDTYRPPTSFETLEHVEAFGSLVLALPSVHAGGALNVKRNGVEHIFDWSMDSLPSEPVLQWGAFHRSCEHEAQQITSGRRITLTYSLFSVPLSKEALQVVNTTASDLRRTILQALETPGFLENGGTLAFGCGYAYAHNSKTTLKLGIETQLKGEDAALFAIARELGLKAELRPVYREQKGVASEYDRPSKGGELVGRNFGLSIHAQGGEYEEYVSPYKAVAFKGARERKDLLWCSRMVHWDLSDAYLTYGNNFEPQYIYSFAVILIKVPPAAKRLGNSKA